MPKEKKPLNDLEIQNANIFALNFAGKERKKNGRVVNSAGTRTFCVEIDSKIAQDLKDDGWNVTMRVNQEDGSMFCYLPVELRYQPVHPDVFTITNGRKHQLEEDQVHQLDNRKLTDVNLVIHPHWWYDDATDEWRIKAFLAEGWFYIRQSRFAEQWENQQMGAME